VFRDKIEDKFYCYGLWPKCMGELYCYDKRLISGITV